MGDDANESEVDVNRRASNGDEAVEAVVLAADGL